MCSPKLVVHLHNFLPDDDDEEDEVYLFVRETKPVLMA